MAGINHMIRNAQGLNIPDTVVAAVAGNTRELERLQKFQMLTGRDRDGKPIGRYKNKRYADEKYRMNPIPGYGVMDFKYSGDFFKDMFVNLTNTGVSISSTNKKTERLLSINNRVFGLNDENRSEFSISYVKTDALPLIKKQLTK